MGAQASSGFKRVPALDKCFAILDAIAGSTRPLGISEISRKLGLNKSTVFNIARTLADLRVLEYRPDGKLAFGTQLYVLGKATARKAELIRTVRPFLEEIAGETGFSAFLGIRFGLKAVIVDKVDASVDIRVSSEVGMRLPIVAGSSGKALLAQVPDSELDEILANGELERFTRYSCVDKHEYKQAIYRVRKEGVALDLEEYIEGIIAAAVPINTHREGLQAAIWAVGLRRPESEAEIPGLSERMKRIATELDLRFGNI